MLMISKQKEKYNFYVFFIPFPCRVSNLGSCQSLSKINEVFFSQIKKLLYSGLKKKGRFNLFCSVELREGR